MKLVEILSLLPEWNTKYFIVKFNDDVLFGEELDEHMYDIVKEIKPEHNSYNNRSYIVITLQPDIYYGL